MDKRQDRSASLHTKDDTSSEDRKIRQDSSVSLSEDQGAKKKINNLDNFIVENIRFFPKVIEFVNAYEGKQFTEKFTIQNIGRNPVYIKVGEPNSFMFQLKKPNQRIKVLPSGCSLTKSITYTYHNDDLISKSLLPVIINGIPYNFPIAVTTAKPEIEVNPQRLNFEVVNLGAPAKSMMLTIVNTGSKRTKFEIDCGKNLDLAVSPMRGTLKPKHPITVRVEIMQLKEGDYYREFWIKTTEKPIQVPVLVEVVRPRLEIPYPMGTGNFTLIHFPPTFNGAQRMQNYILKNISVENTIFTILAEIDGELHELKKAKKMSEAFNMFVVPAEEGLLGPFENRICFLLFRPRCKKIKKGWHHIEEKKTTPSQVILLRISRVHVKTKGIPSFKVMNEVEPKTSNATLLEVEESSDFEYKGTTSIFMPRFSNEDCVEEENTMRLYIQGEAIDPDILIQPSGLEFGDLAVGQTEDKVIRITNKSVISVKCKILKKLNVKTTPNEVWLKSEEAVEFLVRLTPTSAGNVKTKMQIQLLAESDVYYTTDKALVAVGTYPVSLCYKAYDAPSPKQSKPEPLGIIPFVTDEIGMHNEFLTFKDVLKLPYAAVLDLKQGFIPEWMKKEKDKEKNVDKAIVALPNHRPRFFQSWPKDKVCRTIFKGLFRYSPPKDLAYTLTPEGFIKKQERHAIWANYISTRLKQKKIPSLKEIECMDDTFPNQDLSFLVDNQVKPRKRERQNENIPKFTFVPLSPMFLYRIDVQPSFINLTKMAVGTTAQETITIHNTNSFPVSIMFNSNDPRIEVLDETTQIIQPQMIRYIRLTVRFEETGQYYGFLNYVINGSHKFKISVTATVLPKTLILHHKRLEFGEATTNGIFRPRSLHLGVENQIHCPVKYNIIFSEDSAFNAEITNGEIPPRSRVFIEILISLAAEKCFFSEVTLISESGKTDTAKLRYHLERVSVKFLSNRIDMGQIPLNLTKVARPVLYNTCYFDVFFEVVTLEPFPGVTVEPKKGILKARSFKALEVKIKIPVLMNFSFQLKLSVNAVKKLSCQITGSVVFPKISVMPSRLNMRKICENSLDRVIICIKNEGQTPAEVALDFAEYPDFKVEGPSKITLSIRQTEKMVIRFNPKAVSRYNFYLPIIINGILGPPLMQDEQTEFASFYISPYQSSYFSQAKTLSDMEAKMKIPLVCISCNVVISPIRIVPTDIYFWKRKKSEFQPQIIKIMNVTDKDVLFCIRDDDLGEINESPFDLLTVKEGTVEKRKKSMKAELKPGEKLLLKATFQPKKPGCYEIETPVFIRRENNQILYSYIRLKGEASHIRSSHSEIYFAPLPLGIACHAILTISATNCKAPDTINYKIWDPKDGIEGCTELTTVWLDEPNVTDSCNNVFRFKIIFESSIPIALRKYIIFFDSVGTYVAVLVTAVADNSAATTHSFLSTKEGKYEIVWGSASVSFSKMSLKAKSKSTVDVAVSGSSGLKLKFGEIERAAEKEPKLVIKTTKSMFQTTDLGMVNLIKGNKPAFVPKEEIVAQPPVMTSNISVLGSSEITPSSHKIVTKPHKNNISSTTFPNFPSETHSDWNYFQTTVEYVERWIFEMIMKCDQYYSIPQSFQSLSSESSNIKEKDFLHFLREILGNDVILPERPILRKANAKIKVKLLHSFFASVLTFLKEQNCLLPHIRAEYLMRFDDYVAYMEITKGVETFSWIQSENPKSRSIHSDDARWASQRTKHEKRVVSTMASWSYTDKDFWKKTFYTSSPELDKTSLSLDDNPDFTEQADDSGHLVSVFRQAELKMEVLDKNAFELRSTQSWLDILIQVFKVFVLGGIAKNLGGLQQTTYEPSVSKVENSVRLACSTYKIKDDMNDVDLLISNIYTAQERVLLDWLNSHLNNRNESSHSCKKILNNFNKHLSDSVALIDLTSYYCPYIVQDFFKDVFENPDTPNKKHHNAVRLVQAWRTLQLGFTVDTRDIMRPNIVYMLMLLTHLYKVLPTAYPSSVLKFCTPLNSECSKTIELKNSTGSLLMYEAKFFGTHERFFSLNVTSPIEVHESKSTGIKVKFSPNQIKKISATLFFCGCIKSPNFGEPVAFSLEGEPSELLEFEKHSFTTPLYGVVCTDFRVRSPFNEPATYDILYTTRKPEYTGVPDSYFKLWSSIRDRKLPRRLFLEANEVKITEGCQTTLRLTIACFTIKTRNFWLLFRSPIGAFIILIEINPKMSPNLPIITGLYPRKWATSTCTCSQKTSPKLQNVSCPCRTELRIPMRNENLWDVLWKMFFKTLGRQEVQFWKEHFEKNIGIRLILWLLNSNEESEVVDEFVDVLSTRVTYKVQGVPHAPIVLPTTIEIPDVREDSDIVVPIHIANDAPPVLSFLLKMVSESEKEMRYLQVELRQDEDENSDSERSLTRDVYCGEVKRSWMNCRKC